MLKFVSFLFLLLVNIFLYAQKKPLDHTVYDGWQHIGERMISNDGKWIVYTIDPQQGDNELVIQSSDNKNKISVPRGYSALITEDSRFVLFKIKPYFAATREAKIKKKKPDDMPKDSFAIVELGKENVWKTGRVKNYKAPEKGFGWVAYHLEKSEDAGAKGNALSSGSKKITDSLNLIIDSLKQVIESIPKKKRKSNDEVEQDDNTGTVDVLNKATYFADGDEPNDTGADAGTDLVLRNLETGEERIFHNVLEYYFNKTGNKLLVEQAKSQKDSTSAAMVLLYDLKSKNAATLSKGGNAFKNFAMTDNGTKVAYVAERDAKPKELQKFYKLWYYADGMDSAMLVADKNSAGMKVGLTISEFANLNFSKSGKRLFFGTAPIQSPKDTTLVEFEHPKVDIWHYNDDYLQPMQLTPNRLRAEQQKSYLAVYNVDNTSIMLLGSEEIPQIVQTNKGDGDQFYGISDYGKRIEMQWTGSTKKDIYAINANDGSKKLIRENLQGVISPQWVSPTGKYVLWYDSKAKNYFTSDGKTTRNISANVKYPLWDEVHDSPSDPPPYGVMGWHEGDSAVYVYDKYDAWRIDIITDGQPKNITKMGRVEKNVFRYVKVNRDEEFIKENQELFYRSQHENSKESGISVGKLSDNFPLMFNLTSGKYLFSSITKAKDSENIIYTKENFTESPDIYINNSKLEVKGSHSKMERIDHELKLSSINPQQSNYLWGTAELFKWKAHNGKDATGIVYKPENFDPKKKYPMITYFYEKLSDQLYDYKEPAPIRSAINVPFFVSRGYIIFMPDIEYTTGYPGQNAYDYIVSGARAIVKKGWADSTNLALQGHSWGGYQAAQVATMTKLFKAVWAGAPVANMTSAYGGIRWESGMNRQFQYEKAQSRIGATLWEKPNLYITNSPLFHLDKVTAPMVMMHNDGDGAVPWYQGIEMFTGLRRLGKKVWMFNYNGQGHGLTQRQDMLDYQIRMQQFFDWILKGEKPAKWITEGVPAVDKGKDWGLELVD